jgi:hypothetical protein
MQISRIRLSDKTSCVCPKKVACVKNNGIVAECVFPAPPFMTVERYYRHRPSLAGVVARTKIRVLPSLPHVMPFTTLEVIRVS